MTTIEAIPALRDNYIWAIHDGRHVAFVDPGDGDAIVAWLNHHRMRPVALLITHHHADHCAAAAALRRQYTIPAWGPAEAGDAVDRVLQGGETLLLPGLETRFEVLATPGHTLGHLAYHGEGALFCGDTLFSCGCGRLFEGSPATMHASLTRLSCLPADTRLYCAHEYTLANLEFARTIDPDNPDLVAWAETAARLRAAGQPTLPVRLADECRRNPFLRCSSDVVRERMRRREEESTPRRARNIHPPARAERPPLNRRDRRKRPSRLTRAPSR